MEFFYVIKRITKIYCRYFLNSAKIHLYYNDTFFILMGSLARDSVAVAAIYFITYRFYNIGGWEMGELLFLYSLLYISYGLGMLFFAGVRDVEYNIEQGTFDRYLVTPLSIFFQAIVARVDLLTTCSYFLLGFILFRYSANLVGMEWNFLKILFLGIALVGGMLIQTALLFLGSLFSFWTVKTGNVKFLMFFNIRALSIYPVNIYPPIMRYVLSFILPFAFVNYFPAKYILAKNDGVLVSNLYAYGCIFIGITLFLAVYFVWRLGIKNYNSTGN